MTTAARFAAITTVRHARFDVRNSRSSAELAERAGSGFSFRLEARPISFITADGGTKVAAQAQAIVRTDTEESISVVGPSYVPAQVEDFLAPLDPLLKDGTLVPVSAAAFNGGLHRVVELQLPKPMVLPGPNGTEDVLFRRLLWRDSADGSSKLSISESILRQVCKNGMTRVLGMASESFRHIESHMVRARELSLTGSVGESIRRFAVVEQNARRLAAKPMTHAAMVEVAQRLFPNPAEGEPSARVLANRERMVALFQAGRGNIGATAWDAVNAATEYQTHHIASRGGAEAGLARLRNVWFGSQFAQQAMSHIAEVAQVSLVVS